MRKMGYVVHSCILFISLKVNSSSSMSYHSTSLNSSHADIKPNVALSEKSLHEIQMHLMNKQELRLRYIKLMYDAQKILGKEEANDLIKELEVIWAKLSA